MFTSLQSSSSLLYILTPIDQWNSVTPLVGLYTTIMNVHPHVDAQDKQNREPLIKVAP